uniref:Uncharacterized protein n=1 Tax=Romanomermis culicivorax TaxID=13658 RepID=A0A915JZ43_ROMCU
MEQGPQIGDKFQFEIADRRLDQLSDIISDEFYLDDPILSIFGLNTGRSGERTTSIICLKNRQILDGCM